jgi:hypothetical protein
LVAQKLTGASDDEGAQIKPLYRKFEQLNHRVLLHLQDEIAELEEELRVLDETIAQMSAASCRDGEAPYPASRRADRYGSELHFQRTQVLGKVFVKMQQYSMFQSDEV